MENEIMNYEEEVMDNEIEAIEAVDAEPESGIGTGLAMLIGAGLALAGTAAVKFGKKAWAWCKTKKEEKQQNAVTEHDFVQPSEAEIEAVTNK